MTSVAIGAGEWLAWVYVIAPLLLNAYNRTLLYLHYLTVKMQIEIDERNRDDLLH